MRKVFIEQQHADQRSVLHATTRLRDDPDEIRIDALPLRIVHSHQRINADLREMPLAPVDDLAPERDLARLNNRGCEDEFYPLFFWFNLLITRTPHREKPGTVLV